MSRIDTDELIKIIVTQTGLSKAEIEDRMQQKQADLKGLIKPDAALILVAKDLGVDVASINQANKVPQNNAIPHIKINDVRPGMENLTLVGKVTRIFPVKEFTRKKDGQLGKVGSFLLKDETGEIRFVLWNNHAQILEDRRIEEGDTLRAINVIAKANQNGAPELTLSFQGKLELNPDDVTIPDVNLQNLPLTKIADISLSMRTVNCSGVVVQKFEAREFARNGKQGQVASLILQDDTGSLRVTFWTDNIDAFNDIELGDEIEILGVYPKQNFRRPDQVDLNLRTDSIVNKKGKQDVSQNRALKINEITHDIFSVDLAGVVGEIEGYKEIVRKDGTNVALFSFILIDETGAIRVTAWDDKAEELKDLEKGQPIEIKQAKAKKNPAFNQIELSLGKNTQILLQDQLNLPNIDQMNLDLRPNGSKNQDFASQSLKINEINNGTTTVDIIGVAGEIEGYKEIVRKDGTNVALFSFVLIDETGAIRVTGWDDKAEELREISKGQSVEIKGAKVRKNPAFDQVELSLGKNAQITFQDDSALPEIDNFDFKIQKVRTFASGKKETNRKSISEMNPNENITLQGVIIKNFDRIHFYEACPNCRKKIENCTCGQDAAPVTRMIVNATFDDGTDTVRITFFGEVAEAILGENATDLSSYANSPELEEKLNSISKNVVGKEMLVSGRVRTSEFTQESEVVTRTELSVNSFDFIDPVVEAYKVLSEIAE